VTSRFQRARPRGSRLRGRSPDSVPQVQERSIPRARRGSGAIGLHGFEGASAQFSRNDFTVSRSPDSRSPVREKAKTVKILGPNREPDRDTARPHCVPVVSDRGKEISREQPMRPERSSMRRPQASGNVRRSRQIGLSARSPSGSVTSTAAQRCLFLRPQPSSVSVGEPRMRALGGARSRPYASVDASSCRSSTRATTSTGPTPRFSSGGS
jgi:hypothetical protein